MVHLSLRNTQTGSRTDAQNEISHVVTGMNTEELQMAIQQTVSQIFLSTEQRLKNYIDTSLTALEGRLNQKFEDLIQQLVHNGQSSDLSWCYRKNPKNSDTGKIAAIILEFEQCGFTIYQMMQTEWQTVQTLIRSTLFAQTVFRKLRVIMLNMFTFLWLQCLNSYSRPVVSK